VTVADPWHHAVSAARAWGGTPEDYLEIEKFFDESKALMTDPRHRALRHHSEGVELACRVFGQTLKVELKEARAPHPGRAKMIPVRWIGERHIREDLGYVPSAVDWLRAIQFEPWMNHSRRLSRELEEEVV
jgi:hypothetical protein